MISLPPAPNCGLLLEREDLERATELIVSQDQPFGFDIETSYHGEPREDAALHPEESFVAGYSFTNNLNWARYVPVAHDTDPNADELAAAVALWTMLSTSLGVAHGAKFELRTLRRWFLKVLGDHPIFGAAVRASRGYFPIRSCTLLESHATGRSREHGLKALTFARTGYEQAELHSLFPTAKTKKDRSSIRFSSLDQTSPAVIRYACDDSITALFHHLVYLPRLLASPQKRIYDLEMAVLPVVCEMEDEGVLYDWFMMREAAARAREFRDKLATEINRELTDMVRRLHGPDAPPVKINLASPQQVADVLYNRLAFPAKRKSRKTGKPSTDKVALKALSETYPVVKRIQNWKSLTKLIGTYLEKYEASYTYADDGRTHPGHLQHGVPAGRFSVKDPPYQQTPKKYHYELPDGSVFDFNFRNVIMAPAGWYILGFDYSQIELRVIAGESGEQALLDAFNRGDDVHRLTAALMLGKALSEVTDADRALGKTLNFALVYQMGVDGLADRLAITVEAAEALFEQYFLAYPRIKSWTQEQVRKAWGSLREEGHAYVLTKYGRRVPIWEMESNEKYIRAQGERLAGNAPVQGGAADYMKIAMVRVHRALQAAGLADKVRLVMNIHDALEFYVRKDVSPAEVIRVLQPAVVFPFAGWPQMVAEWHFGLRWGSVKELEVAPDGQLLGVKKKEEPVVVAESSDEDEDGPDLERVDLAAVGWRGASDAGEEAGPGDPADAGAGGADHGVGGGRVLSIAGGARPRRVVITVLEMPQAFELARLRQVIEGCPGENQTLLRTPQGEVDIGLTGLSPASQGAVSIALSGAIVSYDLDASDLAQLAAGAL